MEVIKYIISIVKWILIALAVLLIVGLLLGYRIYILESDSMSPKYPKGSLVILDSKAKVEDVEVDDVVGVMVGNSLVFHRVVGTPASSSFSTESTVNDENRVGMADENSGYIIAGDRDPEHWTEVEITNANLLGKLVISIPGLGVVNGLFIRRAWIGWVVAVAIIAMVLVPWNRVRKRAEG